MKDERRRKPLTAATIRLVYRYAALIAAAVVILMPMAWLLSASLKLDSEYLTYPIKLLPKDPQWGNYVKVFTMSNFVAVAFRTMVLALNVTLISVFVSAMCGYAFARFQVPGSKVLFSVVVSLLIVPNIVILIPQFILFSRLHLTNTYWPWFLGALGGNAYFIFMFRQFFLGFPRELEDAAEIDGAGALRLFLQIFLPNAKPALATAMIFNTSWIWGDYLMPIIYLTERNTLLGVKMARAFMDPGGHDMQTVRLAASVIYVIPLIVVFFLGQKNILKGVVTSGLKG